MIEEIQLVLSTALSLVASVLSLFFALVIDWRVYVTAVALFAAKHKYDSRLRKVGVKLPFKTHKPNTAYSGPEIQCYNPVTGALLGTERAATPSEVEDVVRRANLAQKKWAQTSFDERRAVLHDIMEAILANEEDITFCSTTETGKTAFEAKVGEVLISLEKLRFTIRNCEKYLVPESRDVPVLLALGGKKAWLEYHPFGVIGAIVPWNYPFHNFMSPVTSAIFAGNACIVKASEAACWSRSYYEKLIQDVLVRRGHSPDLVHLLPGAGETGAALVGSPGVGKILFIGSPQTGKRVMKSLKPVILELGGKDPFIVMNPCNVELSVDRAINASFFNMGQNCIAGERILVDTSLMDQFTKYLVERMSQAYPIPKDDEPVAFGSMTMKAQMDKVEMLIDDAVKKGAKVLYGGKSLGRGIYFTPTVITGLTKDMLLWNEEAFGPVMLLIPFKNQEEAIEIANSTPFGLGASVHCNDIKRAEEVAHRVESGMSVINDYGLSYLMQDLPFGGCKESGFGNFNGPEGIRGFCRVQTFVSERWLADPSMAYPRFMKRPYLHISLPVVNQVMLLLYGYGLQIKVKAAVALAQLFLDGKK